MPQPFKNAVITNDGARLLTRAQAGEVKIEFTRIVVGDGDYTPDEKALESLQDMRGLKSPKNSFPLSSIEVYSDYSVKISALITNQDPVTEQTLIDAGYFINELGLFAREKDENDSTEVLYSIAVTAGVNGDFMPPYNGYNPVHIIQDYYATVNNSAEVTIQAGTGAVVLIDDFLKLKEQLGNVDVSKGDLQTQINIVYEEVMFKPSTTRITNNDTLITTNFNDGSRITTEITEGDDGKDIIIKKHYDIEGQLIHTYKVEIDGEVITETEVNQDE